MTITSKPIGGVLTALAVVSLCAIATPARAQDRFVTVDYMKVAPGQAEAYLELEQMWKSVHEARVKAGNALGWYLYQVWSPSGTEVHHNYVTVAIYEGFAATENPFPDSLFATALPGMSMADINARTLAARDLVRSETWQVWSAIPDHLPATPARFLNFEYMRVPAGGGAAYLEVEDLWSRIHDVRIADGTLAYWLGLTRVFPGGIDHPYSRVTMNAYRNYTDLRALNTQEVLGRTDLGISVNELNQRTQAARDLGRAELWVLVDYVQASGQ